MANFFKSRRQPGAENGTKPNGAVNPKAKVRISKIFQYYTGGSENGRNDVKRSTFGLISYHIPIFNLLYISL